MRRLLIIMCLFLYTFKGFSGSFTKVINLEDFGAVANDGKDDSEAFVKAFNYVTLHSSDFIIQLPNGTLNIEKKISIRDLTSNISFESSGLTTIRMQGCEFATLIPKSEKAKLTRSAFRKDTAVWIERSSNVKLSPGDIIHIQSNSIFEKGWKYRENDTHRIKKIEGSKVFVDDTYLLFNYEQGKDTTKITIYQKVQLSFKNISFALHDNPNEEGKKILRKTILTVQGCSLKMDNCSFFYEGVNRFYNIGLSVVAGVDLVFNNMKLKNFMYAVLMNYSRNITATHTVAEYCRHAYTPTQACYNVYIEDLKGSYCHSVMDSHVSFYVHYKNVLDTLALQYPNCRALGTTIEDTRIYMQPGLKESQTYTYWSVQTLSEEYMDIYREFDSKFKNVYWIPENKTSLNGLTSYSCRYLLVDNCVTSAVSYYGGKSYLKQARVKDTKMGSLRIDSHFTEVENCILDGMLFKDAKFVFRFTGSGPVYMKNIIVKNFNPELTYMFDHFYNQPKMNSISISNATICKLKGFTNKLIYENSKYDKLFLTTVNIEDFKEPIPQQMINLPEEILRAKKEWESKRNN